MNFLGTFDRKNYLIFWNPSIKPSGIRTWVSSPKSFHLEGKMDVSAGTSVLSVGGERSRRLLCRINRHRLIVGKIREATGSVSSQSLSFDPLSE